MATLLRQRMLDAMVLSGKAARTQEAYIGAVVGLARHYKRSPEQLSADEVQRYLLHLLRERHLSRSSVNQYGCAFRFLFGSVLGLDGEEYTHRVGPSAMSASSASSAAPAAPMHSPRRSRAGLDLAAPRRPVLGCPRHHQLPGCRTRVAITCR